MTQDFGTEVVTAVNEHRQKRDEIRSKPAHKFDTPGYVSDETRRQLINEARAAEEKQLVKSTRQRIEAAANSYPEQVMERREKLQRRIMEPLSDASADMLSRLALSFESDLEDMLEAALATGNQELTGMLFAEATRRDLPDMQQRIAQEVGGTYEEFVSLPKSRDEAIARADLQRQLASRSL